VNDPISEGITQPRPDSVEEIGDENGITYVEEEGEDDDSPTTQDSKSHDTDYDISTSQTRLSQSTIPLPNTDSSSPNINYESLDNENEIDVQLVGQMNREDSEEDEGIEIDGFVNTETNRSRYYNPNPSYRSHHRHIPFAKAMGESAIDPSMLATNAREEEDSDLEDDSRFYEDYGYPPTENLLAEGRQNYDDSGYDPVLISYLLHSTPH